MTDDDALAAKLFSAARLEAPSAEARRRTLRLLMQAQPATARTRVAQPKSVARSAAVISLACAAAAVLLMAARTSRHSVAAVITAEPEGPAAPSIEGTDAAATGVAPAETVPAEKNEAAPPTPVRAAPAPPPSAEPRHALSLAEETAVLDAARGQLARGDVSGALKRLDDYESTAQPRRLTDEATLLRIEVLLHAGRRQAAADAAQRFVERNPNSPLADRARALVADPGTLHPNQKDSP